MTTLLSEPDIQTIDEVIPRLDSDNPIYQDLLASIKISAKFADAAILGRLLMHTAGVTRLVETGLVRQDQVERDLAELNALRGVFRGALLRNTPDHAALAQEEMFRNSTVGIDMF